jgi:hypothetical protein
MHVLSGGIEEHYNSSICLYPSYVAVHLIFISSSMHMAVITLSSLLHLLVYPHSLGTSILYFNCVASLSS